MGMNFPEELSTKFVDTQKTIALKYLEHYCLKLINSEDYKLYLGYRTKNEFEGADYQAYKVVFK